VTARSITPLDIRFAPADAAARDGVRCPVCRRSVAGKPVLDVPALAPPHAALTLLRCGECASVFYDPPGIRDFSDLGATHEGFWRFYAESGGGIWETIWPLLAVRERGSLLDVGCGFGFALDFWQRTGRGAAVGVELADYGARGARELGVTIHRELLQECAALRGRRFDLVYASEVIEHVEDPRAFAALLAAWVSDDGVVVLTTPAAEFVEPAQRGPTQLTALAPGFHGFLLSGAALEAALREAGFAHVTVRRFHERQMVWASQRPFSLDADEAHLRGRYFDYMRERVGSLDPAAPVGQGYRYRLLRDLVNTGRLDEAHALERGLRDGIAASHGAAALNASAVVARYAAATTLDDAGRVGPYFLPCYLHFAGALAQHVDRDYDRARSLYRAASECARDAARIGIVHFPEAASIFWPARIADAVLGLALGDDAGAERLAQVADRGDQLAPEHAYATVGAAQIEALLPSVAEELAARGRRAPATVVGDAYVRYVERAYGAGATLPEALAHLDDATAHPLPADPVFAPYFRALAQFERDAGGPAGRDALTTFVRLAEAVKGRHAPRAGALAARARQIAGLPAPRPFSFEMSFTLPSGKR
jgi:SAM-dependent methyltransferase